MTRIFPCLILMATVSTAWSDTNLQSAKASGKVCERNDGYVAAKDNSCQGLANKVNSERAQEYERIAQKRNVSKDVVAREFGAQLSGNSVCP